MNDTMLAAQAATIILLIMTAGGIGLMWDTARSKKCPECPHCKKIVDDKKWAEAKAVHLQYHGHTTGVPGCEFCSMEGRR